MSGSGTQSRKSKRGGAEKENVQRKTRARRGGGGGSAGRGGGGGGEPKAEENAYAESIKRAKEDIRSKLIHNAGQPEQLSQAVSDLHDHYGIQLPSLKAALPFLDLHKIQRLEFHQSTLELLREKLISVINELGTSSRPDKQAILTSLLDKAFPTIRVKVLQPVVMTLMKHIPSIKPAYLEVVLADEELYREAAVETKRQLWQDKQSLFGDEVVPLFTKYLEEKAQALVNHENAQATFFLPQPKVRRQHGIVKTLSEMIGRSIKLYDMVLQFLRTLYLRSRNPHYCTLRAELLMIIHDNENNDIASVDPSHKFTWCVDACIRERSISGNHARELQGFLDGIRRGQEYVLGDLSMILSDPYAMHTVGLSMMKVLQHCLVTETLPRENQDLTLLVRMMMLGLGAWDMIDSQEFREPKLDSMLITRFLPRVMSMMADDQLHTISNRIPDDPQPPSPRQSLAAYASYIHGSPIASMVTMYYTLHVAKQKDAVGLMGLIPVLVHCENERAYENTYLHLLISALIPLADEFANEFFCKAIFDDFLLPMLVRESVLRHLLRLLWYVHPRLPQSILNQLLESIQPSSEHSPAVHNTFLLLSEKISKFEPSPVPTPEEVDSPLLSVPVPTPMALG